MGRSILGVVLGYIVIFVILFCILTAAYLGMGPNAAFQPGSFRPSVLWTAVEVIVGFGAAIVGGLVCITIARKRGAVTALVVVIIVLGALGVIPAIMGASTPDAVREGGLSNMEAMMKARQPVWMAIMNPILGIVGVLVGSRLKRD